MTPDGWSRVRLSEVADQRTGKALPTEADTRAYVALEHLAQGSPTLLGWSRAGTATSAKTKFRTGDVLFGKLRPHLRKAAPAPFDGVCSTDILPLFGRDPLDTRYLAQLGQWRRLQQHAVATSSGTKMPRTSWAQLGEFQFALPPLPEQRKIAAALSSVDETIEKTRAVMAQLRTVKLALMQELFTRGIPGRHERFKQTSIGELPEEWNLVSLSELAEIRRGASPRPIRDKKWFSDDGPGWVRIADVTRSDRLLRSTDQALSRLGESESVSVRPGDLIMSICATIGKPIVLGINACIHDGFVVFRKLGSQVRRDYLYYQLQAREQQFVDRGQPGTQKNLNTTIVGRTRVPLPSTEEQDAISRILWAADDRIAASNRCLEGLQATKSALMSVLLTGELRVTPDPEHE